MQYITVCKVEKSSHLNEYNFVNMPDTCKIPLFWLIYNNNQKELSFRFGYE